MCGWGRTSSPCPERSTTGPIWSKKMKGPTIRRRMDGSARRTSKPSPRSRVRGTITVSIGDAGSRSVTGSSGVRQVMSPVWLQLRAGAAQLALLHALRMCRSVPGRPLCVTGVHLLHEEPLLCQLQSGFRRELSHPAPAIRDQLLVARELRSELSQLLERHAHRARDVRLGKGVACARVEEDELRRAGLAVHPPLYVRQLSLGAQLLHEVIVVPADVFLGKGHSGTSGRNDTAGAHRLRCPEERREDAMAVDEESGEAHARLKECGCEAPPAPGRQARARSRPGGSRWVTLRGCRCAGPPSGRSSLSAARPCAFR